MAVKDPVELPSKKVALTSIGSGTAAECITQLGSQQRIDRDRACTRLRAWLCDTGA